MRALLTFVVAVPLLSAVAGCVSGVNPPEPTEKVLVKGGTFGFGSETPCFNVRDTVVTCESNWRGMPKTYPVAKVLLSDFMIDEHEVTNRQYDYCVAIGECEPPFYSNTSSIEYYYGNPVFDEYPVVNVTAAQAEAYCAFVGGRLPTEIEWERAAGGATTQGRVKRFYAAEGLTHDALKSCPSQPLDIQVTYCTNSSSPVPIKSSRHDFVSENGVKIWDMAGNVSEWTAGRYRDAVTCESALPSTCDCWSCGAADTACKQDCYTQCDECTRMNGCFKLCSELNWDLALPVCIAYTSPVNVDALVNQADDEGERVIKGGNYAVEASGTCRMSVASRATQTAAVNKSPTVGFRCAYNIR